MKHLNCSLMQIGNDTEDMILNEENRNKNSIKYSEF